jgi:hypothetical protein
MNILRYILARKDPDVKQVVYYCAEYYRKSMLVVAGLGSHGHNTWTLNINEREQYGTWLSTTGPELIGNITDQDFTFKKAEFYKSVEDPPERFDIIFFENIGTSEFVLGGRLQNMIKNIKKITTPPAWIVLLAGRLDANNEVLMNGFNTQFTKVATGDLHTTTIPIHFIPDHVYNKATHMSRTTLKAKLDYVNTFDSFYGEWRI